MLLSAAQRPSHLWHTLRFLAEESCAHTTRNFPPHACHILRPPTTLAPTPPCVSDPPPLTHVSPLFHGLGYPHPHTHTHLHTHAPTYGVLAGRSLSLSASLSSCALMQGQVPTVHVTLVQDLKSIGALARELPPGSFVDEKARTAVVPVPALGPSVSYCISLCGPVAGRLFHVHCLKSPWCHSGCARH